MIVKRYSNNGSNDLHVVYRPCKVSEIVGNKASKNILRNSLDSNKVQHTNLFIGPAGCGKTTAARILALSLNCKNNNVSSEPCLTCSSCTSILNGNNIDVKEINVGQSNGKDAVASIIKDLSLSPFNSRYKVLIFDEAHDLTTAAKDLLLKPTEDGYEHVYFIFCTNQPEKLLGAAKGEGNPFLGRCSILRFNTIDKEDMVDLIKNVCEFEGFPIKDDIVDVVAEESCGIPRSALVWLNQIAIEGTWDIAVAKSICNIASVENEPKIIEMCRAINDGNFKAAVKIFDGIKSTSIETIRNIVCNYFVSCLKNSNKVIDGIKYSKIIDVFIEPIYDIGKNGIYRWYNCMFKAVEVVLSSRRA